jgi:hypothetical protein
MRHERLLLQCPQKLNPAFSLLSTLNLDRSLGLNLSLNHPPHSVSNSKNSENSKNSKNSKIQALIPIQTINSHPLSDFSLRSNLPWHRQIHRSTAIRA